MTLETFDLFQRLPFDLRREIYILATPPRIIHVKEDAQDPTQFEEQFKEKANICVNPDLAYFAPNWRQKILPEPIKQRTLEAVGVSSSRGGPHQPWEPSASTPEIPLRWLQDKPSIAWLIMRENSLYSAAPIPPLLHTWYEARRVLMGFGYTLAFETRTTGPRTWFHFGRDVLFIDEDNANTYWDGNHILTGCQYTILGQFHSKDLKRVRKLALGSSGSFLFPWQRYDYCSMLALSVRLFPDLEELQIAQWRQKDLFRWRDYGKNKTAMHPWSSYIDDPVGELCSLPVEEIDALLQLLSRADGVRSDLPVAGVLGEALRSYQQRDGDTSGLHFLEYAQRRAQAALAAQRTLLLQKNGPGLSTFSWQIPRVKAVHIISPTMAALLQQERQVAWENFLKMKRNWQAMEHTETAHSCSINATSDYPIHNIYTHDIDFGPFSELHPTDRLYKAACTDARQWWAEEGVLAAPKSAVLF
ncbi:hypothetical protein ASPVEDRAFT_25798 [Aspergillus versicolor CBS 583.65]|uniref:2EXR domain-containing protein n=1 Tax=Aspergillus versicolor CBS 583.65 TaxID=1036611 RepID=A0A1L9PBS5_ASPVE|nr:uncharacterized protein ASPVEDRAFT_25798 [Aspergillus versicolor CBS 583.65]OJI98956.1 hypothetical protein ASPVEDRAFT_25798 [Aspergillus versicolor CBS 583.65]